MSLGTVAVYAAGVALGYVVVEPGGFERSLPPVAFVAFARNLLCTVVAEEMLFRQVLQSRLETLLRGPHVLLNTGNVLLLAPARTRSGDLSARRPPAS